MDDFRRWRERKIWGQADEQFQSLMLSNSKIDGCFWDLWMGNAVEAMKHKFPFISELYGTEDRPCLVCGAGPSIHKNADAIRAAQKAGWQIIATDRALKEVRDIGVKEDLSVTTECQPECGDFLLAAGAGDRVAVNLISCPETRNELIKRGAQVFHVGDMCPSSPFWTTLAREEHYGPEIQCVRPGYVVTFAAVDIAFWMSGRPRPIVTIGNDLCYDTFESCQRDNDWIPLVPGFPRQAKVVYCLEDGRFTINTFAHAATVFTMFPHYHPSHEFYDASGGIMEWPQKNLMELVS